MRSVREHIGEIIGIIREFQVFSGDLNDILKDRKDGSAEICVYFDPSISEDLKVTFTKYIHEHLLETAQSVQRLRHFCCSHCQYPVRDNELSRERLREQGESVQLRCQKCDEKFKLWDLLEQKFASSQARQQVQEIETEAKAAIDQDSTELILVGHAVSIAGEAGQLFRQISNHQRGIDGEIEFKDSQGQPSTKRILLLLKPSEFYGHTRRNHKDVFAIADNSLQVYWQKQTCSITLVYRDDEGKIWWMDINDYLNSPYREEFGDRRASNEIIFNGEPFTALNLLRMRDRLLSPRDG